MIRRALSFCALLGFVAAQLAATPHTHVHDIRRHHGTQPHFHLSWLDHGTDEHDHVHGEQLPRQAGAHDALAGKLQRLAADHDADAVYLSISSRVGQTASADSNEVRALLDHSASVCISDGAMGSQIALALAAFNCPPHLTGRHCALFLTLRALRI
jgi:hypothetical protein